jgi:replicative DNA helicase
MQSTTTRSADARGAEPPNADEAEAAVLGAMLYGGSAVDDVLLVIDRPEVFRLHHNRVVYSAVVALHHRGAPVDAGLVLTELKATGKLADAGGPERMAALLGSAATAATASYHARRVRDAYSLRELAAAAKEIYQLATRPVGDADEMLAKAAEKVLAIADGSCEETTRSLADVMDEVAARFDQRARHGAQVGVPTGFADFDSNYLPGWQNGELILVAGRPATGKTALSLSFARNAVERGYPVLLVSMEQSGIELAERLWSRESGVNSQAIRTARVTKDQVRQMGEAMADLRVAKLWMDDWPRQTTVRIAATARKHARQHGTKLVIIDYLQLITPNDRRVSRVEQIGQISRDLKLLARELNVPVICLTQLNRQSEDRAGQEPRLADLREGGSQEQDADTVLLLHRPNRGTDEDNRINVLIAKQRNGPEARVTLAYRAECYRYENFAQGDAY